MANDLQGGYRRITTTCSSASCLLLGGRCRQGLKGVMVGCLFQRFPALEKRWWGRHLCSLSGSVGSGGNIGAETIRAALSDLASRRRRSWDSAKSGVVNLVVEFGAVAAAALGPVLGVDVGEKTLAAGATDKVFGEPLRGRSLALRRRLGPMAARA